jgi:hypothetical protein
MLSTFTVKDSDGTTDVVFELQSSGNNSAVYRSTDSSLASPLIVKVSMALKPVGAKGSDRRTVLVQEAFPDTSTDSTLMDSVAITHTTARSSSATDARQKRVMAIVRNFLALSDVTEDLRQGRLP